MRLTTRRAGCNGALRPPGRAEPASGRDGQRRRAALLPAATDLDRARGRPTRGLAALDSCRHLTRRALRSGQNFRSCVSWRGSIPSLGCPDPVGAKGSTSARRRCGVAPKTPCFQGRTVPAARARAGAISAKAWNISTAREHLHRTQTLLTHHCPLQQDARVRNQRIGVVTHSVVRPPQQSPCHSPRRGVQPKRVACRDSPGSCPIQSSFHKQVFRS